MILTTHAAVASALMFYNPPLAIASHYLIDAIPHKDYDLGYLQELSYEDYGKITLDGLAALLLATWIGYVNSSVPLGLLGFTAGTLPDFLQFVHSKFAHPLIELHQQFHHWCHSKTEPPFIFGVCIQLLLIGGIICLLEMKNL